MLRIGICDDVYDARLVLRSALERARMAAFFGVDQLCLSDLSSVADYENYNLLEGLDAGSSQVQI